MDREKFVTCHLPDCPKKFGEWNNDGLCEMLGGKNCGKGVQKQSRSCIDGTKDKCLDSDRQRSNPCFLKDCEKETGSWKNDGKCKPIEQSKNCGPGQQQQSRHCKDGTVDKCSEEDRQRTIPCSLPDCVKDLGEWEDDGKCEAIERGKNCGKGFQLQTRICKDGTGDKCSAKDTKRQISCELPKCPGKSIQSK